MKEWRIIAGGVDLGVFIAKTARAARRLAEDAGKVRPGQADVTVEPSGTARPRAPASTADAQLRVQRDVLRVNVYGIARHIWRTLENATERLAESEDNGWWADELAGEVWEIIKSVQGPVALRQAAQKRAIEGAATGAAEFEMSVEDYLARESKRLDAVFGCAAAVRNLLAASATGLDGDAADEVYDTILKLFGNAESLDDIERAEATALAEIDAVGAGKHVLDAYLRTVPRSNRDEAAEAVRALAFEGKLVHAAVATEVRQAIDTYLHAIPKGGRERAEERVLALLFELESP